MRHLVTFIFALLSYSPLLAQRLKFDDAAYGKLPQKYSYKVADKAVGLPARVDLSPHAPSVMNQGKFGTCVSFSAAYYARTILEAVSQGITDRAKIDALSFSPSFLYNAIKDSTDDECQYGGLIDDALTYMRENGVARFADRKYRYPDCTTNDPGLALSGSRIMDYIRLFGLLGFGRCRGCY